MLPHVLPYLSTGDLLRSRQTCKAWNQLILSTCSQAWTFQVANNKDSLAVFEQICGSQSSLPVTTFKFQNLDVQGYFYENPSIFRRFTQNGRCQQMKHLWLENCCLHTGLFFEILSFSKQLTTLSIHNTPSIFQVEEGLYIFQLQVDFQALRLNLAKVETLSIHMMQLSDKDVVGLVSGMENLKRMEIILDEKHRIPIQGINESFKFSSKSLKVLTLHGEIHNPGLQLNGLEMTLLVELNLKHYGSLIFPRNSTIHKLNQFLEKCPKLEKLHLEGYRLHRAMLMEQALQKRLKNILIL